jgi:hypothetical protein
MTPLQALIAAFELMMYVHPKLSPSDASCHSQLFPQALITALELVMNNPHLGV